MTDTHHTASTMIAEIADLREKLRVAARALKSSSHLLSRFITSSRTRTNLGHTLAVKPASHGHYAECA